MNNKLPIFFVFAIICLGLWYLNEQILEVPVLYLLPLLVVPSILLYFSKNKKPWKVVNIIVIGVSIFFTSILPCIYLFYFNRPGVVHGDYDGLEIIPITIGGFIVGLSLFPAASFNLLKTKGYSKKRLIVWFLLLQIAYFGISGLSLWAASFLSKNISRGITSYSFDKAQPKFLPPGVVLLEAKEVDKFNQQYGQYHLLYSCDNTGSKMEVIQFIHPGSGPYTGETPNAKLFGSDAFFNTYATYEQGYESITGYYLKGLRRDGRRVNITADKACLGEMDPKETLIKIVESIR